MKIHFGLSLDGYFSPKPQRVINELVCGPTGLLQVLETRLGLKSRLASAPSRVKQYEGVLQIAAGNGPMFFAASLEKDAFAVAETLLGWRDALIEAGWDGEAGEEDPERLRQMAKVEAIAEGRLAPGTADRLRLVLRELPGRQSHIGTVTVLEKREWLPQLWQKVCDTLHAEYGVDELNRPAAHAADGNDLAKARQALMPANGGNPGTLIPRKDNSI